MQTTPQEKSEEIQPPISDSRTENNKLQRENKMLKRKLREANRRYNYTQLIMGLIYAAISTFMLFFVERGITVFSASCKYPTVARVCLYILIACALLPICGSLVALYFRSYRSADKDITKIQNDSDRQSASLMNQDPPTEETWEGWGKRQYAYFTDSNIMRIYATCWFIHALSLAAHTAFFCFAIKGIFSVVQNHFPHPEWHNAIIYTFIGAVFLATALSDTIFYYSVSQMMWWNVQNSCPETKIEEVKGVESVVSKVIASS